MCHHHTWLRAGPGNELLKYFRSVSDVCLFNKSRTHMCKWQLSLGNFGVGRGGVREREVVWEITLLSHLGLPYSIWVGMGMIIPGWAIFSSRVHRWDSRTKCGLRKTCWTVGWDSQREKVSKNHSILCSGHGHSYHSIAQWCICTSPRARAP